MCVSKDQTLRLCVVCDKELQGRTDKVYCNIDCKNKYHSDLRKLKSQISNDTFEIMTKNWVILSGLMQDKGNNIIVDKLVLDNLKFNFSYCTKAQNYGNKIGFFVFNFKYTIEKNNNIYIQKEKEAQNINTSYLFKRWERKLELKNLRID